MGLPRDPNPNPVTRWIYEHFKLPLPIAHGRWFTALKLWHLLTEPIHSDVAPDHVTDADVVALHQSVTVRMEKLMHDCLEVRA